jgi:hypothetical protein
MFENVESSKISFWLHRTHHSTGQKVQQSRSHPSDQVASNFSHSSCTSKFHSSSFSKSSSGRQIEILQDVNIRVLKQSEISTLKEPLCPQPSVCRLF